MKPHKQITNLRTYMVSIGIFVIGIALLAFSEKLKFEDGSFWVKSLMSNVGALLIASVSIASLWELFSKRAFLDELLEKTGLVEDIRTVGVTGISLEAIRGPDFARLIRSSERLDIFVCYANTWRATFEQDLREMAKKRNCRIRLIVPDPDNEDIMRDLAKRFNEKDKTQ